MKKILFTLSLILVGFVQYSFACNNSTISIASQVTNMDGTVTYTLDLTVELGGLDGAFYGFVVALNSSQNTPIVTNFTASISPTGGLSSTLTGLSGSDVNSLAGDSDWNPYLNRTDLVSYESSAIFGAASNDFSMQIQITVDGCVEDILFDSSVNSGSSSCEKTASTGINCAVCSITNIAAATQGTCNSGDNTYTQEIIVTYANPPASGTLDVETPAIQSSPITGSPQTIILTGLFADGFNVSPIVSFSAEPTCAVSTPDLFTAPAPCANCSIDNVAIGIQSACNPVDDSYTQQVTITYSDPPGTGTLDVNGQSFGITGSPQTVTLVGLVANGSIVNGAVEFANDPVCSDVVSFAAPIACSIGCAADNGTWD
jgi:hypothetical protein